MIDPHQKKQLLTDGYVLLPAAVPRPLLERLQAMAARLEADRLADYAAGRRNPHTAIFETADGPVLERLDKLLEADRECALDLLATPAMMAVAREFCGQGAVPLEMDVLFKRQHPNGYVIWHQGAQHSRRWPYLNVGVYLDDAPIDDGCLRYVPGTQGERQDICGLSERFGWDIPDSVDIPAKAGDVLVQDMMVLHCSLPKRSPGLRRTVYIEIRPSQAVVADESQSPEWAELRRRWMSLVVDRARLEDWPSEWRAELPSVGQVDEEVSAIAERWEPPLPAHYCNRPVDHPSYPIPADLR